MSNKTLLNAAKQKKCAEWLASNGITACAACRAEGFEIRDVVLAPVYDSEAQVPAAHGLPMLAVECRRCLHVMLFDAIRMGLMGRGE
ncbi:Hypothetical protein A7982_00715 [Minicystis rosea]|nr:Hypothetical protein A7982_00715 [Minicystis rosea]